VRSIAANPRLVVFFIMMDHLLCEAITVTKKSLAACLPQMPIFKGGIAPGFSLSSIATPSGIGPHGKQEDTQ
jgi:hypothetical protein